MIADDYLVMKNICKCFSTVKVLDGVNFSVRQGEVHGFVGGNGAGKSTFMNILGGIHIKDCGEIFIDGKEALIKNPMDAIKWGVSFIHQELKLFSMRSIADNLFMSRLPTKSIFKFIDDTCKNLEAKKWLDVVELKMDPSTLVGDLSIAQQQMVEIAKALSYESKIIIFDEPTSSLTEKEIYTLYRIIRKLKEAGTAIIYITHKFDEIFELCDRVTVIRNGKKICTVKTNDTNMDDLVSMVIGVKLEQYYPTIHSLETKKPIFEVKNFINKKLNNISFSLNKGEILGIFGLVGAGRSELARALFGLDYLNSGKLYIKGEEVVIKNPKKAIDLGLGFLTEDRRSDGLLLNSDLNSNINILTIDDVTIPIVGKVVNKKYKQRTDKAISDFRIKAKNSNQKVKFLSGGNQQKVALAKWLLTKFDVFIMDEPTRGVDIQTKSEIFDTIAKMASAGRSVILISSEVSDMVGVCHRVIVMRDGIIAGQFMQEEASEEQLLKYAMGGDKYEENAGAI